MLVQSHSSLFIEFSQLRAILALRELASLAKAGERLHLSPSAVFCQIRQLEDELGQKLYELTLLTNVDILRAPLGVVWDG
jgi:Bacterial regulatory helix-turn-helix protein, lysR family